MTRDSLDLLVNARTYVSHGPCAGARARDAHGKPVSCFSLEAVYFCAQGALDRAAYDASLAVDSTGYREAQFALAQVRLASAIWMDAPTDEQMATSLVIDSAATTHDEVMDWFNRAITWTLDALARDASDREADSRIAREREQWEDVT